MKPQFKIRKWSDPKEGQIKVVLNVTLGYETLSKLVYEHGCVTSCWKVNGLISDFLEKLFKVGHLSKCELNNFFSDEILVLRTFEFYMSEIEFKKLKEYMNIVSEILESRRSMKNAFAKYVDDKLNADCMDFNNKLIYNESI